MIPRELAKKVRSIQIFTTKVVNDVLAGEYESVFKGRGMEFDEVREYQVGDDVRSIDWNVTARAGKPFIKKFREERELTVIFLVDLSASGSFGTRKQTKNELAAEICALLAFAAIKNNDKVGLIAFTDQVEMFIPPGKGARYVLRVIREILHFRPSRTRTDLSGALNYLGKVHSRRAVVFLISDFQAESFEKPLRVLGRRHDLIAVSLSDVRESKLPEIGLIELEDAETGEMVLIDAANREMRRRYESLSLKRAEELAEMLRSMGIDHIPIETGRPYIRDLMAFFRNRERRRAYA
jgi:uncharacterized protein (DUF58 family)